MSKSELIELLRRSHAALEAVTDRVGCSFAVAVVLTDCENFLNACDGKATARQATRQAAALSVH